MKPKIFIHIPKCAGMSIRRSPFLRGKFIPAGPNTHKLGFTKQLEDRMKSLGDHHGHEHARWADLRFEIQTNYQAFAIVRNPWDRVVSRYFFAKKVIEVEKKVPESYADVSSFEAFLEERFKWGVPEERWHLDAEDNMMWHRAVRGWYPAFWHVRDVDNDLRHVDILRFEQLDQDIHKYFNVTEPLKPRNVTGLNKGSYQDLYTPQTINIVGDWYKRDIETWGYQFEHGPTKNYWNKEE